MPAPAPAQTTTTAPPPAPPGFLPVNPGANGYFETNAGPGSSASFSVVVKNLSNAKASYRVYAADGTTSQVTGVSYSQAGQRLTEAGSWIQLAQTLVPLDPGGSQTVPFTVTVPAGSRPGDHVGAVASDSPVATHTTTPASGNGANVALSTTARVVVAVVIHVPGDAHVALDVGRPHFDIENGGRQTLVIPLTHPGELLFKPHIKGTVTPCGGGTAVATFDQQLDTFVPRTSIDFGYHLGNKPLPAGCYQVSVATDNAGNPLGRFDGQVQLSPVAAGTATTVPQGGPGQAGEGRTAPHRTHSWPIVGVIAALVVGGAGLLLFLLKRRRGDEEEHDARRMRI